jgi:hypothetical protein
MTAAVGESRLLLVTGLLAAGMAVGAARADARGGQPETVGPAHEQGPATPAIPAAPVGENTPAVPAASASTPTAPKSQSNAKRKKARLKGSKSALKPRSPKPLRAPVGVR